MGPIGVQEMIAIFVVALILFGPKKLPELGRTLGKALSEFRRAKNELKASFESHLHELEREARVSELQNSTSITPSYSSTQYSHSYDEYGRTSYDSSYSHQEPAAPAQIAPPAPSEPVSGTVARTAASHAATPADAPPAEPVSVSTEQDHAV